MVCRETKLLRAVIREDMSMAMVDELIKDITRAVEYLDSHFTINVNDVQKPEGKSLAVRALHFFPLSLSLIRSVDRASHSMYFVCVVQNTFSCTLTSSVRTFWVPAWCSWLLSCCTSQ